MEERKFCQQIDSKPLYPVKPTPLSLFEKFCLFFIQPVTTVDEIERLTTITKTFRGKVYIINQYVVPPDSWNCRHQIVEVE